MILSERIRLRAIEREDIPRFVAWLNDPEVISNLLIYLPLAAWDETRWFENLANRPIEDRPLAVEARQPGGPWVHIGNTGLHNFDWTARSAEFGIFIGDRTFWNNGFGTDVTRLMLKHGFETLNLNRIGLDVYDTNPRAMHVYEKVGFVHEGRRRQANYHAGQYRDLLQMSILRSEWDATIS